MVCRFFPSFSGSISTCTKDFSVGTLVNFENPTPRVITRSASFTRIRAWGDPTFPRMPITHGLSSGKYSFCPERRKDGGLDLLCKSKHLLSIRVGTPAGENHRLFRVVYRHSSGFYHVIGGQDIRTAKAGLAGTEPFIQRLFLDIIGDRDLGNTPINFRIPESPGQQQDCQVLFINGIVIHRNRAEECVLVDFLHATGPVYCASTCPFNDRTEA